MPKKKKKSVSKEVIREIYDRLDDDEISTERLLQMVADEATSALGRPVDVSQVCSAIRA